MIVNWESGDRIDLSGIDANTLLAGNQAFTYRGHMDPWAFHWHGAGSLWVYDDGTNDLLLVGFTDNDSTPDLIINLSAPLGPSTIGSANIIL